MIEHRPKSSLGGGDHGWLKALHHFAIGDAGNSAHGPLGDLIVWNDDEFVPDSGFPLHRHANVEIITYVREGVVTHRDSLGNTGETKAGDVQVMSAGTGIRHEEVNRHDVPTKIFQIWIRPRSAGGAPHWGSRPFPKDSRIGHFVTLASGFAEDADALPIRADARVLGATLTPGQQLDYDLAQGRKAYLVPARGSVRINDVVLHARDGAAVRNEPHLTIEALEDAELVLVDVA